jgi:nicotinate phosphoribosyltransferase
MNLTSSALLTDLYQLTMLQAYFDRGMEDPATFEFFVRKLPPRRNFLVAAGLQQVLSYLEDLRFEADDLEAVAKTGFFSDSFLSYLSSLRFTGDVDAMPEGTLFFPDEPILRVTAPMPQAQLVESRIINLLHFETMIASKAARVVLAAQGKVLADFGFRRSHGAEAGLLAARASYLAGFDSTATVLAGVRFGIPMSGTMAHSFVMAHESESEAFLHFARSLPNNVVFLIDTYDTLKAAEKVVSIAPQLTKEGIRVQAVRIDSGDLLDLSVKVREIFDEGGLSDVRILVSGDLDEYAVRDLLSQGAPIDGFGVGTRMDTSADQPYLNSAYKLVSYAGRPLRKRSAGKATLPCAKQAYRKRNPAGQIMEDVLTRADDPQKGDPLLIPAMKDGQRRGKALPLAQIRHNTLEELDRLPENLRRLEGEPGFYPVTIAPALSETMRAMDLESVR